MSSPLAAVSKPARVALPAEGISSEELQLACRNHGLPLEALRCDVTPPGLHYDIPTVDPVAWRLTVGGQVGHPLQLDLPVLRARDRTSVCVTMECAGNGRARLLPRPVSQPWLVEAVGTAEWTGTPLASVLAEAAPRSGAVEVVFTRLDEGVEQRYQRSLPLAQAMQDDVLLVDEMNGQPLPPQHGFPLRLVVPGWYGMAHVKWLDRIDVVDAPFHGFQQWAYRWRQEAAETGEAITRIEPRALLVPPGYPDFMSRTRFLRAGPVLLKGRAWSGWAPVTSVEVSTDAGRSWTPAQLHDQTGRWAWRRWSLSWDAPRGHHDLCARR